MRYAANGLLGSEFAEYLSYDITAPKSIFNAFQGELFQSRNVVLEELNQNFLRQRRNGKDLICKSIDRLWRWSRD